MGGYTPFSGPHSPNPTNILDVSKTYANRGHSLNDTIMWF